MRKHLYAFLAASALILGVIGISNYSSRAEGWGGLTIAEGWHVTGLMPDDFGDAVLKAGAAITKEFGGGPAVETDNGFIRVQDAPYHTWLATAAVKEANGKLLLGNLYFGQLDPETRFSTKAACEAFRASGDPELKSAGDGLTILSKAQFGPDTVVEFSCSVEILTDDEDEPNNEE